ncbi:MAG: protein kinase [Chloroflexi bacterium]|nr:protein kinase [Chloroflexota bacterium]
MMDETAETVIIEGGGKQPPDPEPQTESTQMTSGLTPRYRLIAWLIVALVSGLGFGFTLAGALPAYNQLLAEASPFAAEFAALGLPVQFPAVTRIVMGSLLMLVLSIPAILIIRQRPDDWVALAVALMLITAGFDSTQFPQALASVTTNLGLPIRLITGLGPALTITVLYVFPSGQSEPRWLRYPLLIYWAWTIGRAVAPNSFISPTQWSPLFDGLWQFGWLGLGLVGQYYRYWNISTPNQRQQVKWILLAAGAAAGVFIILRLVPALAPAVLDPGAVNLTWRTIEFVLFSLAFGAIPVGFMFSILRYRLWDVDIVINRSLVYGSLTVTVLALFGAILLIVTRLFQTVGGGQGALIALALSMMLAGALFQPTRRAVQRFVDRQFYSIAIDYEKAEKQRAAFPTVAEALPPTEFDTYQDLTLVGRGGMAEVYRAVDPNRDEMVAIKVMRSEYIGEADFLARFEREARIMSSISHPNIVPVYDHGRRTASAYLVMPFIDGPTLSDYIKLREFLSLEETVTILGGLAAALDYAHSQSLVHRDIKPSNILLERQANTLPRPMLMDFGIAKMVDSTSQMTTTGVLGTFDYMSPEQIKAADNIDSRADIYSLGVVVYEMLTGEKPFKGAGPAALLIAHLNQPPPDPRFVINYLPKAVGRAVTRAMAKDPDERFQTAGAFHDELQAAMLSEPIP